MSYKDIGDNELIYLIRSNNNEAKEYLIERYKKRIYGIIKDNCLRITTFNINYDDYFQDCFLVFLRCLETYDSEYNFYNYVKRAIEKCIHRRIHKDTTALNYLSLEGDFNGNHSCLVDKVSDSAIIYNEKEFYDYIDNCFNDVDKKIIEHKLKGYSYLEISRILGLNKKYLYKRVESIKNELKPLI